MTADTSTPRFARTPHLVGLVGEAERLATVLQGAGPERVEAHRDDLLDEATIASLRLDGSPLTERPDVAALPDLAAATTDRPTRSGWFDTLASALDDQAHQHVLALEYLGARAALESDDLAATILATPGEALATLHRRLTRGLLAEDRAGRPRTTEQAVHDASIGRILYFATDPADVSTRLALLATWLGTTAAREHALVASGVLHVELLRIHPFEAANGRLARAAARLVLRARGLDPHALAVAEVALARDPIAYHEEVAATARRRDHTIWLERWAEAVTAGLRTAAHRLDLLDAGVPDRAGAFLARWSDDRFTVADYRAEAGVGPEQARGDLETLLDAGRVVRVLGSRGLRFARRVTDPAR